MQEVQANVQKYEEEKAFGGLTQAEIEEAQTLIDPNQKQMGQSRKAYVKELKKVIENADVLLQVLDARDPLGCRCKEIEHEVINAGKKLIFIVNKIDLVPPENSRAWQKYLRREFPTVLFRATKQT